MRIDPLDEEVDLVSVELELILRNGRVHPLLLAHASQKHLYNPAVRGNDELVDVPVGRLLVAANHYVDFVIQKHLFQLEVLDPLVSVDSFILGLWHKVEEHEAGGIWVGCQG